MRNDDADLDNALHRLAKGLEHVPPAQRQRLTKAIVRRLEALRNTDQAEAELEAILAIIDAEATSE